MQLQQEIRCNMMNLNNSKICVVGLGYVGLPLFLAFNKKHKDVCGYDVDSDRILQLQKGNDCNKEILGQKLNLRNGNFFTNKIEDVKKSNIYIFTLPTPINIKKKPDITILKIATKQISQFLKIGDIVIYESTVYPGLTEEVLIPIIEKHSKLKLNQGFFCGYSPERINPGDKKNTLENITKIVSGSNSEVCNFIYKLYKTIIKAKVYKATTIKHAEAAKVIENVQRDINISFINELAIFFNKIGIDTKEVIELASSKWNFIKYQPGLVGGHCIGVDPYYLTYKAKKENFTPKTILSGRKVNDEMSAYVSSQFINFLKKKYKKTKSKKVLILGLSFKENCTDFRNTQVVKIVNILKKNNLKVDIFDPLVDAKKVYKEYNIKLLEKVSSKYHGVIICVGHEVFKKNFNQKKLQKFLYKKNVIYDLKWILKKNEDIETL